jgi:D-alanine--poly(phosphoribitol) ligase subunit 1
MMDVIERLIDAVGRFGDRPAVVSRTGTLSYAGFARRVLHFAASFSAVQEPRVMVALPPGPDAYATMFATLLCGGYYAPVNIASPVAKMASIAEQLRPSFIVAEPNLAAEIDDTTANVDPDYLPPVTADVRTWLVPGLRPASTHTIAYIMFTSGSTGVPKGVMVPRSALNHYIDWLLDEMRFRSDDRVSQQISLGFDVSIIEIFGALCSGASLYPAINEIDRLRPAAMIKRNALTVFVSVPSSIGFMIAAKEVSTSSLGSVRLFLQCGEALLPQHVKAIFDVLPDPIIYNLYGPTEATVSVTANRMTATDYGNQCDGTVALGQPIPGIDLVLKGGQTEAEGELVIFGPQVARGYLHNPQKTDAVFVRHGDVVGYHTGDWVERDAHGRLFFRHRIDFQVKVRGHRVEVSEVEGELALLGWPINCVFLYNGVLAAVLESLDVVEATNIREQLRLRLEDYKVPARIATLAQLPLTESGKLDRNKIATWFDSSRSR